MSVYWVGTVAGLVLVVLALTWIAFRGGKLRREQSVRFVCPHLAILVDCRIVQDIRTGQWKQVLACSAFADPKELGCDRECARVANLGFRQPHVSRAA